ncbi:MAG: hypothetical protein JRN20_13185 [Nitrososphaerota archaeon]|nr:hypothetical protein [Nitrososphaerota archaeon]
MTSISSDLPKKEIPRLYETENLSLDEKIIQQRYRIEEIRFYWLLCELDKDENLAFGYANLNNDEFAEWGYIDVSELLENGADLDRDWKPCSFVEARKKIAREREQESITQRIP